MKFYQLKLSDGSMFKGEANESFSKFGFCIIKNNSNEVINIKTQLDMKNIITNCNVILDYKNCYSHIQNIQENDKNKMKLNWQINYNKDDMIKHILKDNKEVLVDFYNSLDFEKFFEIKRPFKYSIKKLIYSRNIEIDDSFIFCNNFSENLIKNSILSEFSKFRDNFQKMIENKENINNIDNFFNNTDKLFIENTKKLIYDNLKIVENYFTEKFYNNEYSQIVFKENYYYEEIKENLAYSFQKNEKNDNKNKNTIIIQNKDNNFLNNVYINKTFQEFDIEINLENENYKYKIIKNKERIIIKSENLFCFNLDLINKYLYIGEINENMEKRGFGIESDSNNNLYIGYYNNNLFDNKGYLLTKDFIYYGDFIKGVKTGDCRIIFKDNDSSYSGTIKDNELTGVGVYFNNDNDSKSDENSIISYSGEFKQNLASGRGKLLFKNGDFFEGQFANNLKLEGSYINPIKKEKLVLKYNSLGEEYEELVEYDYFN